MTMVLGACLVPLVVRGAVELSSTSGQVETTGAAAERAAPIDDSRSATGRSEGSSTSATASTSTTTTPGTTSTTVPATTEAPPSTTTTTEPRTTTTQSPTTTVAPAPLPPAFEVVLLVNEVRADVGCEPLAVDEELTAAAQLHAEDMSARDYMEHVNPEGMDPTARAQAQGYDGPVGENIAMGYPDAESVMDGWMNSPGHRENIENCDYDTIGVGVDSDGWYWAEVFGL
jgi:uncharacterized protein YkwD